MTKWKVLKYTLNNSGFRKVFTNKNNLVKLSKYLDSTDAENVNRKVAELVKYIGNVYDQEKYKNNPRSVKVLEGGRLELKFKNRPSVAELTEKEKEALKRFGDYNKIDVKDLALSDEILSCLRFYKAHTLGKIIETGEKTFLTHRSFGKKPRRELRNLVHRFDSEAYRKYIGEKK